MTSTLPPLAQATSGSLGAVVSNALIFPLDTLTTRLQTSNKGARRPARGGYSSISAALKTIYRTEGLAAFYSGLGPDSLSTLLSQFIYFLFYSALRDRFQARKALKTTSAPGSKGKSARPPVLSAVEELAIGCLAGVVAKGAVSPLSMITVRAQTSSEPRQDVVGGKEGDKRPVEDSDSDDDEGGFGKAPSALALAKEIFDEQGIAGFWSGFSSTVILVRPLPLERALAGHLPNSSASSLARRRSTRPSRSTPLRRSSAPSSRPSTASTQRRPKPSSAARSRRPSRRASRTRSSSPRRDSSSRARRAGLCTGPRSTCSARRCASRGSRACTRAARASS